MPLTDLYKFIKFLVLSNIDEFLSTVKIAFNPELKSRKIDWSYPCVTRSYPCYQCFILVRSQASTVMYYGARREVSKKSLSSARSGSLRASAGALCRFFATHCAHTR